MKRPGRLSVRIKVGALSFAQAQSIFESLGGDGNGALMRDHMQTNPYTLAEVYAAAIESKKGVDNG